MIIIFQKCYIAFLYHPQLVHKATAAQTWSRFSFNLKCKLDYAEPVYDAIKDAELNDTQKLLERIGPHKWRETSLNTLGVRKRNRGENCNGSVPFASAV